MKLCDWCGKTIDETASSISAVDLKASTEDPDFKQVTVSYDVHRRGCSRAMLNFVDTVIRRRSP